MFVKILLAFTWAFPEFDHVLMTFVKEISKIIENKSYLFLEWVRWCIEYLFCHVDWVSDDNNFGDILQMQRLVNTASNGKKFHFSACDIDSLMKHFDYQFVVNIYVCNRRSDVVFDTCICNHEYSRWRIWWFDCYIIKLLDPIFEKTVRVFTKWIKGKTIRKTVYNSIAWSKFRVEGIERRENFIKPIIHVN